MLIGQMKVQANNTWQDHSLCLDVQWGCSYAFCTFHPDQLSSVSLGFLDALASLEFKLF